MHEVPAAHIFLRTWDQQERAERGRKPRGSQGTSPSYGQAMEADTVWIRHTTRQTRRNYHAEHRRGDRRCGQRDGSDEHQHTRLLGEGHR